ncbi:Mitochondrial fission protein [Gaertneriomyces sp. JEL0708]|nr:Mitochondrial fission protein [Gaertneriomyces sp. JEL0708]
MTLRMDDPWHGPPSAVGEDRAWREVASEKEWHQKAKDMKVPAFSNMKRISIGNLAPSFHMMQRKDSQLESTTEHWKSFSHTQINPLTSPQDMRPPDISVGVAAEPLDVDTHAYAPSEVSIHSAGVRRSESPTRFSGRRESVTSTISVAHSVRSVFDRELPMNGQGSSPVSSSATLTEHGELVERIDDDLEGDMQDDELSPETSITFYQGFRALHPKLATPSKNPASPHSLGLGFNHELTVHNGSTQNTRREARQLPAKARVHATSIMNVARLFTELLNERDAVLHESEKLECERGAISDELRQIEDLLTELDRRKRDLTGRLKRLVDREEKVQVLLDDLDSKIGSIGDETITFERTIRTLKGRSAAITDVETEEEPTKIPPDTCFKTLYGHADSVETLDFDMPFGTLVTGSADRTVRVWDLSSYRCSASLKGHTGWVRTVQVKGQTVISGSGDHTIRQWNLTAIPPLPSDTSGSLPSAPYYTPDEDDVCTQIYRGHTGGVGCLMFDDTKLVSGSVDKTVRQWDMVTGKEVAVLRSERWIDEDRMDPVDRMLLGDHPALGEATTPDDSGAAIVGKRPGLKVYNVGGHVGALQFWQHALAAGYGDGVVRLWDLRTGKCHRELAGHLGAITTLKFDQSHVISGSVDKTIKVWDLRAGEAVDNIRLDGCVNDLHHDMFRITIAAGSKEVEIYNRTTSVVKTLEGHAKAVRTLKHMDDTLISGGMDTTVRIWRI